MSATKEKDCAHVNTAPVDPTPGHKKNVFISRALIKEKKKRARVKTFSLIREVGSLGNFLVTG